MKKLLLYFVFTFMFIYLNAQQAEFSSTNSLEPENFSVNQLSSIAIWEASGDTTVQPILFKLFLSDTLYAEVPGDEFSFHFNCLTYGLDYTASIQAVYNWAVSDTVNFSWTSTYLPTVQSPFVSNTSGWGIMTFTFQTITNCTGPTFPEGLASFNLYRDGVYVANFNAVWWEPYPLVLQLDDPLPQGTYIYCASAIWELSNYGYPGDFGESAWCDCDTIHVTWVGIEDKVLADNVEIYPNPLSDQITISSSVIISEITVFDQLGNQLLVIDGLQSQEEILDISMLKPGVYILKLKTENGIVNKRVVKM